MPLEQARNIREEADGKWRSWVRASLWIVAALAIVFAVLYEESRETALLVLSPAIGAYFALLTGIFLSFVNYRIERALENMAAINEAMAHLNHSMVTMGFVMATLVKVEQEYRETVVKTQRSISPLSFSAFEYAPQLGGRFLKDELNNMYHSALAELRKVELSITSFAVAHNKLSDLVLQGTISLDDYHRLLLSLIPQIKDGLNGCKVAEATLIDFFMMCKVIALTESSKYFLFFPNKTFSNSQRELFPEARKLVVESVKENLDASKKRMMDAGITPWDDLDPPS